MHSLDWGLESGSSLGGYSAPATDLGSESALTGLGARPWEARVWERKVWEAPVLGLRIGDLKMHSLAQKIYTYTYIYILYI